MSLFDGATGLFLYLSLKAILYLSWSYAGVRWLAPHLDRPVPRALALGVARLVVGWFAGAALVPFVLVAGGMGKLPLFYFTGLALVRWLEWGLVQWFISERPVALDLLTAGTPSGRRWRSVGVLVSYLPDVPFLLSNGFPEGRFLC